MIHFIFSLFFLNSNLLNQLKESVKFVFVSLSSSMFRKKIRKVKKERKLEKEVWGKIFDVALEV